METLETLLPLLLGTAWLLPPASFVIILFFGPRLGKAGVLAGYVATGAILCSFVLSSIALGLWLTQHWPAQPEEHGTAQDFPKVMEIRRTDQVGKAWGESFPYGMDLLRVGPYRFPRRGGGREPDSVSARE